MTRAEAFDAAVLCVTRYGFLALEPGPGDGPVWAHGKAKECVSMLNEIRKESDEQAALIEELSNEIARLQEQVRELS